ncbi:MAG TPA: hypothetical protein DD400_01475 [Rhodospirillaceae bacterium]|nr:hypothetical protein [Rhodospirillaceae bacterium]
MDTGSRLDSEAIETVRYDDEKGLDRPSLSGPLKRSVRGDGTFAIKKAPTSRQGPFSISLKV